MPDVHIKFMGEQLTVREFVVDDIEAVFADNHAQEQLLAAWQPADGPAPIRWFDRLFDREMVSLKMVELATGLDARQIGQVRPSDLRGLVAAVREANPDFFAMLESRAGISPPPGTPSGASGTP